MHKYIEAKHEENPISEKKGEERLKKKRKKHLITWKKRSSFTHCLQQKDPLAYPTFGKVGVLVLRVSSFYILPSWAWIPWAKVVAIMQSPFKPFLFSGLFFGVGRKHANLKVLPRDLTRNLWLFKSLRLVNPRMIHYGYVRILRLASIWYNWYIYNLKAAFVT